jgi:hypothetical protein
MSVRRRKHVPAVEGRRSLDRVEQWPSLSDEQVKEFNAAYVAVTGG